VEVAGVMISFRCHDAMYIENNALGDELLCEFQICDQYPGLEIITSSTYPRIDFTKCDNPPPGLEGLVVPLDRIGNHGVFYHVVSGDTSVLSANAVRAVSKTLQQLHDESHLDVTNIIKTVGNMKHVTLVGPRQIEPCIVCGMVKMKRQPFERSSTVYEIGARWSCDIQFASCAALHTLETMLLIFVDERSDYVFEYPMTKKSQSGLGLKALIEFCKFHRGPALCLKIIQCDRAKEFLHGVMERACVENGIQTQTSVEYVQAQNGKAENTGDNVFKLVRANLVAPELPPKMWRRACNFGVLCRNVHYTAGADGVPWETFTGLVFDYRRLQPFGCLVVGLIPKEKRKKLDPKGYAGIFTGFPNGMKGCEITLIPSYQVVVSRHVVFYPNILTALARRSVRWTTGDKLKLHEHLMEMESEYQQYYGDITSVQIKLHGDTSFGVPLLDSAPSHAGDGGEVPARAGDAGEVPLVFGSTQRAGDTAVVGAKPVPTSDRSGRVDAHLDGPMLAVDKAVGAPDGRTLRNHQSKQQRSELRNLGEGDHNDGAKFADLKVQPKGDGVLTRSARAKFDLLSASILDGSSEFLNELSAVALVHAGADCGMEVGHRLEMLFQTDFVRELVVDENKPLPKGYLDAVADPVEGKEWEKGTAAEMANMDTKNILGEEKAVEEVRASGEQLINSGLVFKRKYRIGEDDEKVLTQHKVRIVGKELKGERGKETYAPTPQLAVILILLAWAFQIGMHIYMIDFDAAFLNGRNPYTMWLRMPVGMRTYNAAGKELCRLLIGNLYGTTTAGRIWNQVLSEFLTKELGFVPFVTDSCVFKLVMKGCLLVLWVHVDDCGLVSTSLTMIQHVGRLIKAKFSIKGPEKLKEYLSMRLLFQDNCMYFDGRSYMRTKLELFGYMNKDGSFKKELAVKTPMNASAAKVDPESPCVTDVKSAQVLIGALIWASVVFRQDIKPAVLKITRFMQNPTVQTVAWCDWLWRYIGGTLNLMLAVKRDVKFRNEDIFQSKFIHWGQGAFDSTWEVPKSVSGFLIFVFGLLVCAKSSVQTTTALSSTEAEIIALLLCCKHAVFIRSFVSELVGVPLEKLSSMLIFGDNIGALKAGNEGAISNKLKHMNLAEIKIHEWKQMKHFVFRQCSSWDNASDFMTKVTLSHEDTVRHRSSFMKWYTRHDSVD
jgi:hypothetical protein